LIESNEYEQELLRIKEELAKEKERTEQLLQYKAQLKSINVSRKYLMSINCKKSTNEKLSVKMFPKEKKIAEAIRNQVKQAQ
jgi:hypothetical protein